jgi:integrase
MALSQLMRGMSFDGLEDGALPRWRDGENRAAVPHGFRATFKSWTRATGYPDHLSEIALAHKDKDKVRAAYAREDLLEQRRPMMEAWAKVCTAPAGSVTNIKVAKRH